MADNRRSRSTRSSASSTGRWPTALVNPEVKVHARARAPPGELSHGAGQPGARAARPGPARSTIEHLDGLGRRRATRRAAPPAGTWADYLSYDAEHAPFDAGELREFVAGLVEAGLTRSGHRTPAVIVSLPVDGSSEAVVRANAWMIHQALAAGVHGLLLCHAETPERRPGLRGSRALPSPHRGRRRGAGGRAARERRAGPRGGDVGADGGGVHGPRGSLAAQPRRGAAARAQDRERPRSRQRRGERGGARDLVRRVGPGRHGALDGASHAARPAVSARHARGPDPRAGGLPRGGHRVPGSGDARRTWSSASRRESASARAARRARPRRSAAATRAAPCPGSEGRGVHEWSDATSASGSRWS